MLLLGFTPFARNVLLSFIRHTSSILQFFFAIFWTWVIGNLVLKVRMIFGLVHPVFFYFSRLVNLVLSSLLLFYCLFISVLVVI